MEEENEDTAARKLCTLISKVNGLFKNNSTLQNIRSNNISKDYAGVILKASDLHRDAYDEIIRAGFSREGRTEQLLRELDDSYRVFLNAFAKRSESPTSGALVADAVIVRLSGIADQVENAEVSALLATSRADMIQETEDLISEVKEWDIEEYSKKTLLIQLNSVSRIIQVSDTYSSVDIRKQVQSVIANFAAEFEDMDREHKEKLERILLWARRGFFAGTSLLGLTSDVVSITAALPAP